MRKNFGQKTWMYPMPVLMIGTYDENGKANLMNAAWGGIYNYNHVVLSLSAGHKTTQKYQAKRGFYHQLCRYDSYGSLRLCRAGLRQ